MQTPNAILYDKDGNIFLANVMNIHNMRLIFAERTVEL